MRRSILVAAFALVTGCLGGDTLGPVQTVDGQWDGIQNGYALTLVLAQDGTIVDGIADLAGVGGFLRGDVSGTFQYPNVDLTIEIPTFVPIKYIGTMSTEKAEINGRLNGGGFSNLQLNVRKHD